MSWIDHPAARHPRSAPRSGVTAPSPRPSDRRTMDPVPDGCLVHSFQHSFRDRLRAARCPAGIIDALGGWSTAGIGSSYGDGFELGQKSQWMGVITSQHWRVLLEAIVIDAAACTFLHEGRIAAIRCECKDEIGNGQTGLSSVVTVHLLFVKPLSSCLIERCF
jgi:hypothetical protein